MSLLYEQLGPCWQGMVAMHLRHPMGEELIDHLRMRLDEPHDVWISGALGYAHAVFSVGDLHFNQVTMGENLPKQGIATVNWTMFLQPTLHRLDVPLKRVGNC